MLVLLGNQEDVDNLDDIVEKYQARVYLASDMEDVGNCLDSEKEKKVLLTDSSTLPYLTKKLSGGDIPSADSRWQLVVLLENDTMVDVLQLIPENQSVWHLISGNSQKWKNTTQVVYECAMQDDKKKQICRAQNIIKALENKQAFELSHSDERPAHIDKLSEYISDMGAFQEFANIVMTSADELLSNAFYNAQRDPYTGMPVHHDRTVPVQLPEGKLVRLIYGVLDGYLWLFVVDPFGTMTNGNFSKSLVRALKEKQPNFESAGGAGLGLMMLYTWASQMTVQVKPGQGTRVGCQFLISRRRKQFSQEEASVHFRNRD